MKKVKVLIFLDWFLPGFKAGGPIKSIENILGVLKQEVNFDIITRDRDIQSTSPYPGIEINEWMFLSPEVRICYLSPGTHFNKILSLIKKEVYSAIYVNSFFSFEFSIKIRILFLLGFIRSPKFIIAPRGEMKASARAIKPLKKKLFFGIAKKFLLYKSVYWHSTSALETLDIKTRFGATSRITELPNFSRNLSGIQNHALKIPNELKLIFLSRIVPYKNLSFVLDVLSQLNTDEGKIQFDIYGPKEDLSYWENCTGLIAGISNKSILINYKGEVPSDKVSNTFADYHLFFFPTFGENFGHVIAESLLAGTPVLTSNNTPWNDMEENNSGWAIELNDQRKFIQILRAMLSMSNDVFRTKVQSVLAYSSNKMNNPALVQQYIAFLS